MKKLSVLLVTLALLCVTLPLFAEDSQIWWGSNYMPGNLIFHGEVGYETIAAQGVGVAAFPEVEYIIFKPIFGDVSPVDIGAAVRMRAGFNFDFGAQSLVGTGIGVFATVHFGFKGLGFIIPELIDNFDVFSEVGFAFDFARHYTSDPMFGFAGKYGIAWQLNDALAIKTGYQNWVSSHGPFLGAHLKFGPGQEITRRTFDFEE